MLLGSVCSCSFSFLVAWSSLSFLVSIFAFSAAEISSEGLLDQVNLSSTHISKYLLMKLLYFKIALQCCLGKEGEKGLEVCNLGADCWEAPEHCYRGTKQMEL